MNKENRAIAAILIVLGLAFLLVNSGALAIPRITAGILWPSLLILLGIALLWTRRQNRDTTLSGNSFDITIDGETVRIGEWELDSPAARLVVGIIVGAVALLIAGLVIFGVVGPVLVIVLGVVGVILLIALGIPLLALIIPLAIVASPIIVIVWLLRLLFF